MRLMQSAEIQIVPLPGLPEIAAGDDIAMAICQAIESVLAEPAALEGLAERSRTSEFTLDKLYTRLGQTEKTSKLCWNN